MSHFCSPKKSGAPNMWTWCQQKRKLTSAVQMGSKSSRVMYYVVLTQLKQKSHPVKSVLSSFVVQPIRPLHIVLSDLSEKIVKQRRWMLKKERNLNNSSALITALTFDDALFLKSIFCPKHQSRHILIFAPKFEDF